MVKQLTQIEKLRLLCEGTQPLTLRRGVPKGAASSERLVLRVPTGRAVLYVPGRNTIFDWLDRRYEENYGEGQRPRSSAVWDVIDELEKAAQRRAS